MDRERLGNNVTLLTIRRDNATFQNGIFFVGANLIKKKSKSFRY